MRFSNRRRIAGSSSHGMFVAPSTRRPSTRVWTPCIWTRNSVLILREASFSLEDLCESKESTSSMKTTAGSRKLATQKSVRTSFSDSPIHFDMREEAEIEKNVAPLEDAIALPINVLPVPGGPNKSMPRGTARKPVKSSGLCIGQMTISVMLRLASSSPAMSSNVVDMRWSIISDSILLTSSASQPLRASGSSSSDLPSLQASGFFCATPFRSLPLPASGSLVLGHLKGLRAAPTFSGLPLAR
mmetsp:Transcript_34740/g.121167  ORF Transcript_34740/g.121167 Transcript_34740/m.121167 type:complete len:243 (-) Transcript_34740:31-759(-)